MSPTRTLLAYCGAVAVGAVLIFSVGAADAPANLPPSPPEDTTDMSAHFEQPAEKVFKNIQVFRGRPAKEVNAAMRFINLSLGVHCGHCHVPGNFASDSLPAKKTARAMIMMTEEINSKNFGVANVVTCYTCHRGKEHPSSTPKLSDTAAPELGHFTVDSTRPLQNAQTVVDRYVTAIGGRKALESIRTSITKLEQTRDRGPVMLVEVSQKAPDAVLSVTSGADPASGRRMAFNGRSGWGKVGTRPAAPIFGESLAQLRRTGEIFPGAGLGSSYRDIQSIGAVRMNGKTVDIVMATGPDGAQEWFYFDSESGLLVRRYVESSTILGSIPFSIDYDDYRTVGSVKLPHTRRWTTADGRWTERVTDLRQNVPVDDATFRAP